MLTPVSVLETTEKSDMEMEGGKEKNIRCNVLWNPLPCKDTDKDEPEEPQTLLLHNLLFASVQRIEQLNSRNDVGVHSPSGIHEEDAHDTRQTVSDELRADQGEDTNCSVRANVVVQVLCCEDGDGKSGIGSGGTHDGDCDVLFDVCKKESTCGSE